MSLLLILTFYILSIVILPSIAIYFYRDREKVKKKLNDNENAYKQKIYELSILQALQERIGYSLDGEKIMDIITGSLTNLFPFSTASSLSLHEDKLVFHTYVAEKVGERFIQEVKKSMLASLANLSEKPLPTSIEERKTGFLFDEKNDTPSLRSFFHIPLIITGQIVGIINLSSTKEGLYKEEEMTMLYQIIHHTSTSVSQLKEVINLEKGKLVSLITSLTDGIIMIDRNNELSLINKTAKNLLDITFEKISLFDVISALSRNYDFGKKLEEAKKQNKIIEEKELTLGKNTLQVSIIPVLGRLSEDGLDNQAKVIGIAILLHDITLEKSLTRMKEDFTNAVVHELRSPLTAIELTTKLLLTEKKSEEEQKKFITTINSEAKELLLIIGTLLDAAKLENGKFILDQKNCDVDNIIKDCIDLFSPQAKSKNITLTFTSDTDLPQIFVDSLRISQVLHNLISNSLKFTKEGGSIIISAKYFYENHLPKTNIHPGVIITVSDNGSGIPKEKQRLLFSKFSQIQTNTPGTGLGLYITKGIVEAHGGSIFLSSEEGKGTSISFTLPIVEAKQETKDYDDSSLFPNGSFARMVN